MGDMGKGSAHWHLSQDLKRAEERITELEELLVEAQGYVDSGGTIGGDLWNRIQVALTGEES